MRAGRMVAGPTHTLADRAREHVEDVAIWLVLHPFAFQDGVAKQAASRQAGAGDPFDADGFAGQQLPTGIGQ